MPWRGRCGAGASLPLDPMARRWEASRTGVENPLHVLVFYRDEGQDVV